jgi:hypothetical protein
MNSFPRLVPADRHRLDDLVRRSNAARCRTITDFVDCAHRPIGESLRSGSAPDAAVQRLLDALRSMQDYAGTSYRVSRISRNGLAALQDGVGRSFADRAVQCAFVLPSSAAAWARHAAASPGCDDEYPLFSIFDESVPQKNLSSPRLADCVAVPPGTALRLTSLRLIGYEAAASPSRARIVAQFGWAGLSCGTCCDLYSGAPHD